MPEEPAQPADRSAPPRPPTGHVRHFRWNYIAHSIEGGLFLGALNFVNATTVLPSVVRSLGGSAWLVSKMPILAAVGVLLPPIFTAHAIDRLRRYMPLLLVTGIFQRLPYLVAGLMLLSAGGRSGPALAAAVLAPLVSGIFCGVSFTAWQQLLIRTVPEGRRSGLFAIRCVMSSGLGLLAGWAVKAVLAARPGAPGYGILYLCTFGGLALSYVFFAMIRESPAPEPMLNGNPGLLANLRAMPALVRGDRQFALYLAACVFFQGGLVALPFLAIHARSVLHRPESWLGELVVVQMVGSFAGNLLAGWLGDRSGGKRVLLITAGVFVALAATAAFARSEAAFRVVFFALGFTYYTGMIGGMTLSLEICPPDQRATRLAIISFVRLVSMWAASEIAAVIGSANGRYVYAAAAGGASMLIAMVLLGILREPRTGAAGGRCAPAG